jgi:hypothetical protein
MSSGTRAVLAMSDGRNHFKVSAAPAAMNQTVAAQFLDYDNDGLLDLLAVTAKGMRLGRNVGNNFIEVSAISVRCISQPEPLCGVACRDRIGRFRQRW